jgi:hypothetical protein
MDMHEQYTTASDDQYYEHDGSPSEPYSPPRPSREKKRIQKKENADDFLFSHGGKSVEGKVQQAEAAVRRTKEILHSLSKELHISGNLSLRFQDRTMAR